MPAVLRRRPLARGRLSGPDQQRLQGHLRKGTAGSVRLAAVACERNTGGASERAKKPAEFRNNRGLSMVDRSVGRSVGQLIEPLTDPIHPGSALFCDRPLYVHSHCGQHHRNPFRLRCNECIMLLFAGHFMRRLVFRIR